MSLETALFIKDLVATNPLGTDPKSQGDDHLRMIKAVLKSQFPGFTDGVGIARTENELNRGFIPVTSGNVDLNSATYRGVTAGRWQGGIFTNAPVPPATSNAQVEWFPAAPDGSYGCQTYNDANSGTRYRRYYRNAWSEWTIEPASLFINATPGAFTWQNFQLCWGDFPTTLPGQTVVRNFARPFAAVFGVWPAAVGQYQPPTIALPCVTAWTTTTCTIGVTGSSAGSGVGGSYLALGRL